MGVLSTLLYEPRYNKIQRANCRQLHYTWTKCCNEMRFVSCKCVKTLN